MGTELSPDIHFYLHEWFTDNYSVKLDIDNKGTYIRLCDTEDCFVRVYYDSRISWTTRDIQFRCQHKFTSAFTANRYLQERVVCTICHINYYYNYLSVHSDANKQLGLFDAREYEI